ncbi:MAG: bifunctional (p)ppGpp synthetase/guanosine-3',5'-bis(diphosphate) 3'-pyrophosphohydrolase [Campylobacterales bacterium]|nr:bifunctional (p)ppGpp synthetase/guanosine-3',5'-bis(diphosphate) 3'-pyrophosphohydrolase [Campylobacterales bacterium]
MHSIDLEKLRYIHTLEAATEHLYGVINPTAAIKKALDFAITGHEGQFRRSGEPYIIHPILVASIVGTMTEDESMVLAALMHDLVEDTACTIDQIRSDYGADVAHLVEGMTKIDHIRDAELVASNSNEKLVVSALSFRKMLLASIEDVRVLVVKLCDRLHNMLTLGALPPHKQHRIAEETLVVYAPIAHRLGISFLKKMLEDLSFHYLFPEEERKIDSYLDTNYHAIELKLNAFRHRLYQMLLENGFNDDEFEIIGRVKHHYSIYLKMQRKGIGIDEILDLLAVRILLKRPLDCYTVLGLVHLNFQPLSSRFKDYIALAKDNGYQTLHTTVFDHTAIFEVQIRTYEMHKTAELGVAAHWKYKSGSSGINLDWLNNLQYQNESVEEFYELIKNDLYSEDISVFSPKGRAFTLPRGAVALDFAYAVHTEVGDKAEGCLINKEKASLLSELHNGDIVNIITGDEKLPRCSWIDAVKTSRAKSSIRANCNARLRNIDAMSGINILATIIAANAAQTEHWLEHTHCCENRSKLAKESEKLKEVVRKYEDEYRQRSRFKGFLRSNRFRLKSYQFGSLEFLSNQTVSAAVFDYCCHPKTGDEVVAFIHNAKAHVHHKMCKTAGAMIERHEPMLFVRWVTQMIHHYHMIVSMQSAKGALADFLTELAKLGCDINSIELGKEKQEYIQLCEIEFQNPEGDINRLRGKIEQKIKVIQFFRTDDAYRSR